MKGIQFHINKHVETEDEMAWRLAVPPDDDTYGGYDLLPFLQNE